MSFELRRYQQNDMPSHRMVLKHIHLSYEEADTDTISDENSSNSSSIVAISDPITEDELKLLNPRTQFVPPDGSKVLLHSCCAPCSGAMIEEMKLKMNLDVTIFFYNPNIHPKKEYEIRKLENIKYAERYNIPFVDCDYDSESWFKRMVGFDLEPERGVRCSACFDMRMEVTAAYAIQNGFDFFTTTNATSRWKDDIQVNLAGIRAAALFQANQSASQTATAAALVDESYSDNSNRTVKFWVYNWKSDSMTRRKYEVSVEERFYKQEYCGCSYSLRDSNIWRAQQGIPPVRIGGEVAGLGTRYFENVEIDEAEESQEVVDSFFHDANSHFGDKTRLVNQQIHIQKSKTVTEATDTSKVLYSSRLKSSENISLNNW